MIYFVRHGETTSNASEIITGRTEVELSENGLKQALIVAEALKNIKIDAIYCSPLKRTMHTCEIVNKNIGLPINYDNRILARDYGKFEGVRYCDMHGELNWNINVLENGIDNEPIIDMAKRVFEFIDFIKHQYGNKNVLVVSHSSVGKIFNCYFNGFPTDGNVFAKKIKNAEVVEFRFDE